MATTTLANVAKTATLSANTADSLVVTGGPAAIELVNLSTTLTIWAAPGSITATIAGDDCVPLPPLTAMIFNGVSTMSIISSGTAQYTLDKLGV